MNEHALQASRVLMGDSLGFHILFVMFGLTLPIMVSWFEYLGMKRKDPRLTAIAQFWSKLMAMLVVTGIISGTIIALQMSLVWPGVLQFGGKVLGLPFMFETYAFLIEAIFLSVYMVSWKRLSPMMHWLTGLLVIFGSSLSAFMITAVNAWMNYPTGFTYVNGELKNISIPSALFSRTSLVEFFHSMPAYFFSVVIFFAGCYAYKLLKLPLKERLSAARKYDRFVLKRLVVAAIVLLAATAVMGDVTGKYLATHEPGKLAAMELNYTSGSNAPLVFGGTGSSDGTISGPHLSIPGGLSVLAGNSPNTYVQGLDRVKENERPPLYIHVLFDVKMILVSVLTLMAIAYVALRAWRPKVLASNGVLYGIFLIGISGMIMVELGWMLTEIGRQPWAVRGYVTTAEAVTKTHDVSSFGYLFPLSYVALFILTVVAARKLIHDQKKLEKQGGVK